MKISLKGLLLAICVTVLIIEAGWRFQGLAAIEQISHQIVAPTPLVPAASPRLPLRESPTERIQVNSFTKLESLNRTEIAQAQTSFLGAAYVPVVSQIDIYELKYQIRDRRGDWTPIVATVYIPRTSGNYPLYVFGSGTTGIADQCAPSRENMAVENLGNYANHMIAQAAEGYVMVFPDYEGYQDPQVTEAYFIKESEARVMLGAILALRQIQAETVALDQADLDQVFLGGYSQGGHAALAAAEAWSDLPSSVRLKGVVLFAGAVSIQDLFWESPHLAGYLTESIVHYYGSDRVFNPILQEKWSTTLAVNNQKLCVNQAYRTFPNDPKQMYLPAFIDALESNTWPATLETWKQTMDENTPLSNLPQVPYLSVQGQADPIVSAADQQRTLGKLCQLQLHVQYLELNGVNHFQVRQAGFVASNQWLRDVVAGSPTPTNCP